MSEPLKTHNGIAAVLMRDNVDTDQIIPSREMKSVGRLGLADGLFAGWRYTDPSSRTPDPEFVLNKSDHVGASILIGGENFGCGSSREHAVWALKEFGIRIVIAKSFGEIFHGNCVRNGLLPITLSVEIVDGLAKKEQPLRLAIDLESQTLTVAGTGETHAFAIDAYAKRLLVEGLDPIALTLKSGNEIDAFFERDRAERPWVYSAA